MPDLPSALPPVTVPTPTGAATVTTVVIKRRPWKLLMLNVVNGVASAVLAVLAYLQSVNLNGILTPEKALVWMVVINVANIVIRQFFSPPQVVETRVEPAPSVDGQP